MKKYSKLFNNHSEYNTYISGNKVLPNVSYCKSENDVHYNPWIETKLVCKYNITDTTSATTLRTELEQNMFKSMEIDGVLLDDLVTEYQFDTTGEHTVKYELYDETKVGNNAPLFNSSITTLTSITIPNSVITIGNGAFNGCTSLTSVVIGNNVTTIGDAVFTGCSGLTSITIPDSVTTIGGGAFYNCTGLTSVSIPDNVTSISGGVFQGCTGLTSITIGNSITTIGVYAFQGCSGITNLNIPDSVTTIGLAAFAGCTSLTDIIVGKGITSISNYAFANCNFVNIKFNSSTFTRAAFFDNNNTKVTIRSVILGNNVRTIDNYAFEDCAGLTNIVIGNSVTSIGIGVFTNCSSLTNVTIPNSVTTIGDYAFEDCTGLTSIISLATAAPAINDSTFRNVKTGGTLYVPTGSTGYDIWMGTGSYYLGKYNWTKVEQ